MDIETLAQRITSTLKYQAIRYNGTTLMVQQGPTYRIDGNDEQNAQWIVWCLDRLEEMDREIYIVGTKGEYEGGENINNHDFYGADFYGKTRAELVTNALFNALKSRSDQPTPASVPAPPNPEPKASSEHSLQTENAPENRGQGQT